MNLYQVKLDKYESYEDGDNIYPAKLFIHDNSYTQEQFQDFIRLARIEMQHQLVSMQYLSKYLEKYGFKEVITGYFEE